MPRKSSNEIWVGRIFGYLTVISEPTKHPTDGRRAVICRCICNKEKLVRIKDLIRGHTKGDWCWFKPTQTHGLAKTPTYLSWLSMKQRCLYKKSNRYKYYAERGIEICEKWMKFEGFLEDMDIRPKGTSLGRIDNDKGYFKENCRWETPIQQANNKRNNVFVEYNGEKITVFQLARKFKIDPKCLWQRIFKYNIPIEDAVKNINLKTGLPLK